MPKRGDERPTSLAEIPFALDLDRNDAIGQDVQAYQKSETRMSMSWANIVQVYQVLPEQYSAR